MGSNLPQSAEEVRDVCELAAKVLERDGWTQGISTDSRGRHCLVGAIHVALQELGYHTWASSVVRHLTGVPPVMMTTRYWTLWNDQPTRTAQEVIDVLRNGGLDTLQTNHSREVGEDDTNRGTQ